MPCQVLIRRHSRMIGSARATPICFTNRKKVLIEGVQLSLAIVTRNRPESLARCLDSIRAGLPGPVEIVVSDDSERIKADETKAVCGQFGCRYLTGPHRGLYANRNQAAV